MKRKPLDMGTEEQASIDSLLKEGWEPVGNDERRITSLVEQGYEVRWDYGIVWRRKEVK